MEVQTANAGTNTNTFNQIGFINADKTKKKPHNINIKNFNPNEPKIRRSDLLYSDKQKYRRYKTKIEPKLFNKIMVDDEEDLIAKIRKEFGIEDKTRKNYSSSDTSGTPFYEEPNPVAVEQERVNYVNQRMRAPDAPMMRAPKQQNLIDDFTDMTNQDFEDLVGEIITSAEGQYMTNMGNKVPLPLSDDEEEAEEGEEGEIVEEVNEALLTSLTIEGLKKMSEDELKEISKKLYKIALKNNFTYSGKKPKKPEAIFKRAQDIINEITNMNKTAETSEVVEKK